MATTSVNPLRFRGSPRSVESLSALTPQRPLTAALSLDLKLPRSVQAAAPLTVQTEPIGALATRLRFSLPETTPPGVYEGTVQIGKETYPITVEVEPHTYLVISPRQLILQAAAGTEVAADLTIVNSGNVPCEITKAHAFGLFDVKGADRAVGAALADPEARGQDRLGRLMDEAADNHGGLVRVAVREGSGVIKPGELRTLHVVLRFSERLKPGHTYWGTWPLHNLEYYVKIDVVSSSPTATKRSESHKESS
jgi:hypothetical protein